MDVFNENDVDQNAIIMTAENNSLVYIIGASSQNEGNAFDAAGLIEIIKPDAVVVDLCSKEEDSFYRKNNAGLISLIIEYGFCQGVFEKLVSRLLSDDTYLIPTGEFRSAIVEAKRHCNRITFGDRPLYITLCRLISMLGWIKCIKILARFYWRAKKCLSGREEINSLINLVNELNTDFPELEKVLIDERNKYFTYILQKSAGIKINQHRVQVIQKPKVVVGVVGFRNISSIKNYWGTVTKEEYDHLSKLLPQSTSTKIIKFAFKVSVCGLLLWGISKTPDELKPILAVKLILHMF